MTDAPTLCLSCLALSGERPISPGETIYAGRYWMIEHAYPCGMIGWLVIVLKRHAEALHELTSDEWQELGALQSRAAQSLRSALHCEKEYMIAMAEVPGFQHIHIHVVAKPSDLSPDLVGTRIFALLKVSPEQAIPAVVIAEFCAKMRDVFNR